jgi:hypothetical protein
MTVAVRQSRFACAGAYPSLLLHRGLQRAHDVVLASESTQLCSAHHPQGMSVDMNCNATCRIFKQSSSDPFRHYTSAFSVVTHWYASLRRSRTRRCHRSSACATTSMRSSKVSRFLCHARAMQLLRSPDRCHLLHRCVGDIVMAAGSTGQLEAGRIAFTSDSVAACVKCCKGFFHEEEYAARCADGCGVTAQKVLLET